MGKTSAEVKNRYNSKNYKRISLQVKFEEFKKLEHLASENNGNLNGTIRQLINEEYKRRF